MRERHNEPDNNLPYHMLITCTAIVITLFYFILFYFILFYFILFYFILFYFILFYFILFYFVLFYFRVLSVWLSGVHSTLTRQPLDSTLSHYLVREYRDTRMSFGRREGEFN